MESVKAENVEKVEKNKSLPIYYKSFSGKTELDESNRKVSGYFANFDTIDSHQDIIRKGAFLKSINERGPESTGNRKIKYLHQHNLSEISGPLTSLFEDDFGLGFEGSIEKTAFGDIILERYMNGTYNEHSFGFLYVFDKCEWIKVPARVEGTGEEIEVDAFECKELQMFEGSVVTFGSNQNTPFTGFKGEVSDIEKMLDDELKFLLKHSPNYDYELRLRQYYAKQFSLASDLAVKNTKDELKPKEVQTETLDFLRHISR